MSTTRLKQILPISIITIFSLIIRLWHLNSPKGYIFDEVYYAKNANSLIQHGVELNEQGGADFIVHPPFGKWLIGIGIRIFGNNEFGWRIIPALVGTACVIIIYLIAQRLFNSIFLSSTAALLMALDGLALGPALRVNEEVGHRDGLLRVEQDSHGRGHYERIRSGSILRQCVWHPCDVP